MNNLNIVKFFLLLNNMAAAVICSKSALVITEINEIIWTCVFGIQGPRRTMHHMIDLFSYPEMVLLSNVTEVKIKNCSCETV